MGDSTVYSVILFASTIAPGQPPCPTGTCPIAPPTRLPIVTLEREPYAPPGAYAIPPATFYNSPLTVPMNSVPLNYSTPPTTYTAPQPFYSAPPTNPQWITNQPSYATAPQGLWQPPPATYAVQQNGIPAQAPFYSPPPSYSVPQGSGCSGSRSYSAPQFGEYYAPQFAPQFAAPQQFYPPQQFAAPQHYYPPQPQYALPLLREREVNRQVTRYRTR